MMRSAMDLPGDLAITTMLPQASLEIAAVADQMQLSSQAREVVAGDFLPLQDTRATFGGRKCDSPCPQTPCHDERPDALMTWQTLQRF